MTARPVVVTFRLVPPHGRTAEFSGSGRGAYRIPSAMEHLGVPGMKHAHRRLTWQCAARFGDAVISELETRYGAEVRRVLW